MIAVPKIGLPSDAQLQERNSLDPPELGTWSVLQEETPPDPPPVPTNGSAVWNASAGDLELSWTGSDEASTYQVRISAAEYTVRNIRRESYEIRASVILGLQYSQTALVRACDDRNTCSDDLEIEFLPPIPAPDNFRVAGSRSTEIDLAWDAVEHRAGYEHDYKESSSTRWLSVDLSTRLTSRTVTGLACGTRYDFRMRTAGGSGTPYSPQWGPWSDIASGSTAACDPTNEFPPLDSPTAEAAADGGSIDVAFRLPSAEFKYLLTLYRSADGKSYSPHLTPVELDYGDASPHTFSGLVPSAGGWYQARLKACRDDERTDCGAPAYSNVVTLPEPTTNRPPAFDRTSYSFTVALSATTGTVASYSLNDASRFAISSSGEISVGASLTGLAGTSVTLTVTATDDDGATASVEIEIRVTAGSLPPADAPGSLVLNHPGDTFIVVEWHASAHAAEYAIEMLRSGAWERTEGITDEYHVFERLTPGTEYRFRVQAKGDGVNRSAEEWSAWSQTLVTSTTGTAPPPGPPTRVGLIVRDGQLEVDWNPPESDGGSSVSGHQFRYRIRGMQAWTETAGYATASSRNRRSASDSVDLAQRVINGLSNGTEYDVEVHVKNSNGYGPWTEQQEVYAAPAAATIAITSVGDTSLEVGGSTELSVRAENVSTVVDYTVRLSTSGTGGDAGVLKFNSCGTNAADSIDFPIGTDTSALTISGALSVYGCAEGGDDLTATLIGGGGDSPSAVRAISVGPAAIPTPTFASDPEFAADGVTVDTEFSLPRDGFHYRLTLYRYISDQRREVVERHNPVFGDSEHAFFIGRDPDTTQRYFVGLKACQDESPNDARCSDEALSGYAQATSVAEVTIGNPASVSVEGGRSTTFSVDVDNLAPSQTYTLQVHTDAGAILKFDGCGDDGEDPKAFDEVTSVSGIDRSGIVVFACVSENASDEIYATLSVDGVEIDRSGNETVNTAPIPIPQNLRASGDSRNHETGRAEIKWVTVAGSSYGYQINYGEECFPEYTEVIGTDANGDPVVRVRARGEICDNTASSWNPVETQTDSGHILSSMTISKVYRVQVRRSFNGVASEWSDPVFVYPSDSSPSGTVATTPFFGYWPNHSYTYIICTDTIPSTDPNEIADYQDEIEIGIQTWEETVRWEWSTSNMVNVERDTATPCAEVYPVFNQNELRFVESVSVLCAEWANPGTKACMRSPTMTNPTTTRISTADLYFVSDYSWDPSEHLTNTNCSRMRAWAVHESGHSFGLGTITTHPNVNTSIMQSPVPETYCQPQPYDIVAMMALYQTR